MSSPWQLYDDLIDLIPAGIKVVDACAGNWACVSSEAGTGVAMTYSGGPRAGFGARDIIGRDLRDAAASVKSWDLELAALGTAAINSYLTTEERVGVVPGPEGSEKTIFELHRGTLTGLRAAAIGHFGDIEKYADGCDFIVLERQPSGSDFPDPAAEYLLADRDLVFITGSALTNKTLPRLLQLCAGAKVILVGPSVPFAPEVLPACVVEIGGSLVSDSAYVRRAVSLGGGMAEARPGLRMFNRKIRSKP